MSKIATIVSTYTFELAFTLVWMVVGINWLTATNDLLMHSSVEGSISTIWVYIWGVLYVVGGPIGIYGVLKKDASFRVCGLILTTSALLMNGVAAMALSPELRDVTFFIWAGAGTTRIIDIVKKKCTK